MQKSFISCDEMNSPSPLGTSCQFTFKKYASQVLRSRDKTVGLRESHLPVRSVRSLSATGRRSPPHPRQLKASWTGQCAEPTRPPKPVLLDELPRPPRPPSPSKNYFCSCRPWMLCSSCALISTTGGGLPKVVLGNRMGAAHFTALVMTFWISGWW